MAYTPSVSELDSHQGDAKLAIGGGGSMAGNLPIQELFSPEVINKLSAITDTYVADKNKEYDEFVKKVATAKQNISKTDGVYVGDLEDINKSKRELYSLINKKRYLMTPDAPIKYAKEYQEMLDMENQYMQKVDRSKNDAILDKILKEKSLDPKYNNPVFQDQYNKWKSSPLGERTPFVPLSSPTLNVSKILSDETNRNYQDPILKTIGYGKVSQTIPYTLNDEKIVNQFLSTPDATYYEYQYNLLPPEEQAKKTKVEYIKEQLNIPTGTQYTKPTIGTDQELVQANIDRRAQINYTRQDKVADRKIAEAQAEQTRKARKEYQDKINDPKFAIPKKVISEIEVISNAPKGKKTTFLETIGIKDPAFEITDIAKGKPTLNEWLGSDRLFILYPKGKEAEYYKVTKGGKLSDPLNVDVITSEVLKANDKDAFENYNQYQQLLNNTFGSETTQSENYVDEFGATNLRNDGTNKGNGFFGVLKMKDGSNKDATEISIGVEIDGKETEIPTLVPTLSEEEKDWLLKGGNPLDKSEIAESITIKAIAHAEQRIKEGKSPFNDTPPSTNKTQTTKGKFKFNPKTGKLELQ